MDRRRILEIGGLVAGVVLILFGAVALYLGIDARQTVGDEITRENIVGSPDMSPDAIRAAVEEAGLEDVEIPSCDVAEEEITTGDDARCFAQYMRIHALESSNGLTYAQMGRFVSASDPSNPAGTSDEEAALKDDDGRPVSNAARNTWVTETALSTALNVSYMASQIALFSIVVGIALILAGIGFVILATVFSLCTQAYALGHGASDLAGELQLSPALLIVGLLPHALPELTALFLPLAAWTIASRRGAWKDLLAATFVTVAIAVPVLVAAAAVETWISPRLLLALAG